MVSEMLRSSPLIHRIFYRKYNRSDVKDDLVLTVVEVLFFPSDIWRRFVGEGSDVHEILKFDMLTYLLVEILAGVDIFDCCGARHTVCLHAPPPPHFLLDIQVLSPQCSFQIKYHHSDILEYGRIGCVTQA